MPITMSSPWNLSKRVLLPTSYHLVYRPYYIISLLLLFRVYHECASGKFRCSPRVWKSFIPFHFFTVFFVFFLHLHAAMISFCSLFEHSVYALSSFGFAPCRPEAAYSEMGCIWENNVRIPTTQWLSVTHRLNFIAYGSNITQSTQLVLVCTRIGSLQYTTVLPVGRPLYCFD